MDAFAKLHAIALENGVSLEELCVYAQQHAEGAAPPPDAPEPPGPV